MTRVGANLLLAGESFENFHYANCCRFVIYCNAVSLSQRNVPANALEADKLRPTHPNRRYYRTLLVGVCNLWLIRR